MKYEKFKLRKLNYRAETVENVKITRPVFRKFQKLTPPPLLQNTPDTVNKLTDKTRMKIFLNKRFKILHCTPQLI